MGKTLAGKVVHYYDKIGVAIIDLSAALKEGDKISIEKDNETFEQQVSSMQAEHEKISSAKKGQSVGLKVSQPVKQNAQVFKVTG